MEIGVSILTNGARKESLKDCIENFLDNCHYRPLLIGIVDNGSTDDTWDWADSIREKYYGVNFKIGRFSSDSGCAQGTNASIALVKECKYQIHLESDFHHLTPIQSGIDKMWLHRAVEFMEKGECDFLYLRRMRDIDEAYRHWWVQWMLKITQEEGEFFKCPTFWWSNNPALFNTQSLCDQGILPLDPSLDGKKGEAGWSEPELKAGSPSKPWIMKWGVFVHEADKEETFAETGCKEFGPYGHSGCKYGWWIDKHSNWCQDCDKTKDFRDMKAHLDRAQNQELHKRQTTTVAFHLNQLGYRGTDTGSFNYACANEEVLGNRSIFLAPRNANNTSLAKFKGRFPVFLYEDWSEVDPILSKEGATVLHMRKDGRNDGKTSRVAKTCIHCAFKTHESQKHGDVYVYISEWLGAGKPWVPHIVKKPPLVSGLREELGIPKNAFVFGRHGGAEAFDIEFVKEWIVEYATSNPDVYFLFLGTPFFGRRLPNVIFLNPTDDEEAKWKFIFTCDAMLHARHRGETFGLAVAEFSAAGRPVLTYGSSPEKAHLEIMGASAFTYFNKDSLLKAVTHLRGLPKHFVYDCYTERFSSEKVMAKFKEVFID